MTHQFVTASQHKWKEPFRWMQQMATKRKIQHIYAPIPASVDETTLFQFMNDKALKFDQETKYRQYEDVPFFTFRHPRHGKQKNCSQ